jgi:hypothetical protein
MKYYKPLFSSNISPLSPLHFLLFLLLLLFWDQQIFLFFLL